MVPYLVRTSIVSHDCHDQSSCHLLTSLPASAALLKKRERLTPDWICDSCDAAIQRKHDQEVKILPLVIILVVAHLSALWY